MLHTLSFNNTNPLISYKQDSVLDENGVAVQITETVEQVKRKADGSPDNVPSRKRAAFGDITNVRLSPCWGYTLKGSFITSELKLLHPKVSIFFGF